MVLGCGRKLENLWRTHSHWENMQTLYSESSDLLLCYFYSIIQLLIPSTLISLIKKCLHLHPEAFFQRWTVTHRDTAIPGSSFWTLVIVSMWPHIQTLVHSPFQTLQRSWTQLLTCPVVMTDWLKGWSLWMDGTDLSKYQNKLPHAFCRIPFLTRRRRHLSPNTRYKWSDVTEIKPWLKFWYENQWEPNYQHLNVASTLLLPRSAMSAISNSWLGRPIPAQ